MGARITGTGRSIPSTCVDNAALARRIDTTDDWIVQRTGIRTRHLLDASELPSSMGAEAGRMALDAADTLPSAVDLLLVATNFPVTVEVLDVPVSGVNAVLATNTVFITTISSAPPLKLIRVETVWAFRQRGSFTNTTATYRAPDQ